ncbi:MAG TPA: guanine permease, partial [Sutterella sp.]|nr:guanine permease [Sutterella sp.]
MQYLDMFFHLKENKTDFRTEFYAALTTFMAMAYIIVVNPGILSETGMPFGSVLVATCLGAAIGCFLMAFLANYPFALAPGMGLNAFFTYTVCLTMGISWKVALTAVFVEGVIFILLTLTNVRQKIVNTIPNALKIGIAAGIGLFIAFIGLKSANVVVSNPATFVSLGAMNTAPTLLAVAGFLLMVVLTIYKVRGAILIGIIATTIVGIPLGVTKTPDALLSAPPSLGPIFFQMDFTMLTQVNFWVIVFAFFFVDFFDTIGTLVGCASHANMLDEKGQLPKAGAALMSDAV